MSALVRYEAARGALAAAHSLDEVKDIRDKSEAMAAYARQAHDVEMIAWATEIKVRAERRCGEMLRDSERAKPADTLKRGQSLRGNTMVLRGPTLAEIGISKHESSRWQRMAALPEKDFETVVEVAKAQVGQVTSAAVLRAAKASEAPTATTKLKPKADKQKPGKKTKPVAKKAEPEHDPDLESPAEIMADMHKEIDNLHELVKAADADDQKAEALKWRRAYDAAVRGQSEAMDRAHKSVEREKATKRQLMRCGKAVGEDDEFKIAPAVEAMARAYKAERIGKVAA